ncbi:calcium-binding protein [Siccirubricoccus phaeus]|uniref:calcium-binding protein n=1 Tax=Siccirubricoccus phaeus TaxID=2595053 RepID=UPI0011F2A8FA|nr:calcium-binding protein [Siccirubricoccus phaeus]
MGDYASIIGGDGSETTLGGIGSGQDAYYHIESSDVILNRGGTDGVVAVDATGAGDTYVQGGSANDIVLGGAGDDSFKGGEGGDSAEGGAGDDVVEGNGGDDTLDGGADDDKISGGDGADYLMGGDGDDTIAAGAGDDVLIGGLGDDLMMGQSGNDIFVFDVSGFGDDTISGFQVGDVVHIVPGVNGINSLDDLAGKVTADGSQVKIDLGAGATITVNVAGVSTDDLVNNLSAWVKVQDL